MYTINFRRKEYINEERYVPNRLLASPLHTHKETKEKAEGTTKKTGCWEAKKTSPLYVCLQSTCTMHPVLDHMGCTMCGAKNFTALLPGTLRIETGTGGTWSPHRRHLEDLTQAETADIWAIVRIAMDAHFLYAVRGKNEKRRMGHR